MREIVHIQAGQCGNQIGAKVRSFYGFELNVAEVLIVFVSILRFQRSFEMKFK